MLPRRKLIWSPQTHRCFKKNKQNKTTPAEHTHPSRGGVTTAAKREVLMGISGERWRVWKRMGGTEDTVECACPAMMTRCLSHHCAAGLPLPFLPCPPPPPPRSPPRPSGHQQSRREGVVAESCCLISSLADCSFFQEQPRSLVSPSVYLLIPGPTSRGAGRGGVGWGGGGSRAGR